MSEIKTINGKVEFLCVSLTDKTKAFASDLQSNSDIIDIWFILSTITEEQASLFVDYAECRINGVRVFYDYGNKTTSLPTAKESLFSLLKANGCWTKGMRGDFIKAKSRAGRPIDIFDKTEYPDDYLLIIKQ